MSTSFTRPQSASACTGLRPPNVTVSAACTAGPVIAPVSTSMPLGMSTATTGIAASSAPANTSAASGRSGPDPEMPTTPSMTRSVVAATLSTIRPPACGERCQTLLVGAFRFEQYRVGGRAAAAQEGCRPQRVTAVVAGADDRADPPSGNPAGAGGQLADDRGRQAVGRPPHQSPVGQAGQQRRFGVADRVSRVVVPHQLACPPLALMDRFLLIALRALHRHRSVRATKITGPGTRVQSIKQAK